MMTTLSDKFLHEFGKFLINTGIKLGTEYRKNSKILREFYEYVADKAIQEDGLLKGQTMEIRSFFQKFYKLQQNNIMTDGLFVVNHILYELLDDRFGIEELLEIEQEDKKDKVYQEIARVYLKHNKIPNNFIANLAYIRNLELLIELSNNPDLMAEQPQNDIIIGNNEMAWDDYLSFWDGMKDIKIKNVNIYPYLHLSCLIHEVEDIEELKKYLNIISNFHKDMVFTGNFKVEVIDERTYQIAKFLQNFFGISSPNYTEYSVNRLLNNNEFQKCIMNYSNEEELRTIIKEFL